MIIGIFDIILIIFGLLYLLLIVFFLKHWLGNNGYICSDKILSTKVSVIVAFRNEVNNLSSLLESLKNQSYQNSLFEVILVDDNSEDSSCALVEEFIKLNSMINLRLIKLSQGKGKKEALKAGIASSKGELIVTTDADCSMGREWLKTIVSFYEEYHPSMIVSPVLFAREKGLLKNLQAIEFLSLIASGGASLLGKKPLMCNGANLAFTREAFDNDGGYTNGSQYASGDDMFLMLSLAQKDKEKVLFLKSNDAVVFTNALPSISSFINQRKRWTSKSTGYNNAWVIGVAMLIVLINMLLVLSFVISAFNGVYQSALLFFLIKFIADALFMFFSCKFFKQTYLIKYLPLLTFCYSFYVLYMALVGNVGKYKWKGRLSQ